MSKAMAKSAHKYVVIDEAGEAFIQGARVKVKNLVVHYKWGMTLEEILEGFPNISSAQLFDALSYYHDHRQEVEASLERDDLEEITKEFNLQFQSDRTLKQG